MSPFWCLRCFIDTSDTDHFLVIAEVREKLSARKQATQKTDMERYNLKKLNEMEVKKQFQIELSNKSAALENLNDSEGINRAWENKRECQNLSQRNSRYV
jgi:hypothetical protein